jgi:hypothetical protein
MNAAAPAAVSVAQASLCRFSWRLLEAAGARDAPAKAKPVQVQTDLR